MTEPRTGRFAESDAAKMLGAYALLGGFLSFLGWFLDVPRLTDWFDDSVSIQPNACVLLMLAGTALVLIQKRAWRAGFVLGALTGLGGALILLQYFVGIDFGINHQLLFGRTWGQGTTVTPGRVGPPASTSFTLTGIALMLLAHSGLRTQSVPLRRFVPALGVTICILMAFSLLGYLFGAKQFYTIPWLTAIAIQTAIMITALGMGLVFSALEHQPMLLLCENSGAGTLARITLPTLILMIPIVLWLRVQGHNLGHYDLGTGRALGALVLVVSTVTILWIALLTLRRREQALTESEVRHRTLVHVAVHGVITIDEQGLIESVNPAAERQFGYTSGELIGRNISMLMPEPNRSEHGSYLSGYLRTGVRRVIGTGREVVGLRKDGSTFPMDLAVSEFRIRHRVYYTGIVVDVSKPKQAEQALRESEARLGSIIEQLPAGVGVMNKSGVWTLTNSQLDQYVRKAIPLSRSDRVESWQARDEQGHPIPPERRPGQRALNGETISPGLRIRCEHEKGDQFWMSVSAAPLRDDFGEIIGAICVVQDITELRKLEHQLQETVRQLAAADRRKDEFLATLAHELRNPLAPVINSLALLEDLSDKRLTAIEARTTMRRQLGHMVRLIDDLLDVSRISRGTFELRKQRVQLHSVIEHAVESVSHSCQAAGQRLEIDLPDEPVWIEADPVRLAQVIGNLLSNASRYSADGTDIVLRAELDGSDLLLSVIDQGIGIPPEMLDAVFEIFSQLDRSLERTSGGLGIGLYLVKRLVQMHGGVITAHSEGSGHGTRFTVRLPVVASSPEVREQVTSRECGASESKQQPTTVLVVDDNKDAANTMAMLLRGRGYVAHTAYDGLQAVDASERIEPDLILLDIGMPGLNGYDACRKIRLQPNGKNRKIVALSGWGQEQDKRQAEDAGFDAHLVKPVDPSSLIELLESL